MTYASFLTTLQAKITPFFHHSWLLLTTVVSCLSNTLWKKDARVGRNHRRQSSRHF